MREQFTVVALPYSCGPSADFHVSFFVSPDGSEDWILYHANPEPGMGCGGKRSPRMQRFDWDAAGMPRFGTALTPGDTLAGPAGG